MKTSHIFWGVFLVVLGVLILLNNFGTLYFDWELLLDLWPLILILIGLSIFLKTNNIVKGFIVAVIAALISLTIFSAFNFVRNIINEGIYWNDKEIIVDEENSTYYSEPFDSSLTNAELNFNSGAGYFVLKSSTENLIGANSVGSGWFYDFNVDSDSFKRIIDFSLQEKHFSFNSKYKNQVSMKLHPEPVWNVEVNAGAAKILFDLSELKIENIDFNMGAASIKVKMGDKLPDSRLNFDGGVSSIEIEVPEESGCEIRTETVLTNKRFPGFNKINSGYYRTANFESAQNKIYLSFDAGISSIKVKRYSSSWEEL